MVIFLQQLSVSSERHNLTTIINLTDLAIKQYCLFVNWEVRYATQRGSPTMQKQKQQYQK
jgi:hypothetical protein